MKSKRGIWGRFQSQSLPEIKRDEEEQSGGMQMSQYQLCVEEIKREGNILGSLELHEEAMRRLKQRSPRASDEGVANNARDIIAARRNGTDRPPPPRAAGGGMLSRSLMDLGLMVKSKHGHAAACDPSREMMAGRRQSTWKPRVLGSVEYDEGVTAAQVLGDLDLSDSEDGERSDDDDRPVANGGSNGSGGRRGSLLGRAGTTIGRRASSTIGRPLRSAARRYSNRPSLDLSDLEDEEHVPPTTRSPTRLPGGRAASGSNSVRRPVRRYLNQKRRSTVSTDGGGRVLVSKTGDDADEGRGNPLQILNDAENHTANIKEGGISTPNDQFEKNVTKSMASWQRRRRTMHDKRRSSLFSLDERRASIDDERRSSNDRSSLSSSGFDDSMTEDSTTGSIASKARRGSLICSFQFNESDVKDGSLICDWERRQSMVSDSSCAKSNQVGSLDGKDGDANNRSLICGWDRSEATFLSRLESEL